MIKKEIDGVTYYCFEESEEKLQKQFENDVAISDEVLVKLMDIAIESIAKIAGRGKKAWMDISSLIDDLDDKEDISESVDEVESRLTYDWKTKMFKKVKQ